MSSLVNVKGLVIRNINMNEADRLITVFTEEHGAVSAMAKGARGYKSRQMSSTLVFCYGKFVLYKKGDMYWVKESELIESFFDIRRSVEGLALASYIAEVLSDVTVAEADCDLLRLSLNSLYAIASGKYSIAKIKAAFEIRCAAILGFMPDVLACTSCKEKSGDFFFNIMGGSILCYSCNEKQARAHALPENPNESSIVTIITEGAKQALGYCIYCPIEKIFSFNISDGDMACFSRAAEDYLINQLERSFKTLEFYKEVCR